MERAIDKAVNDPALQRVYSQWAVQNNNGHITSRDWELVRLGANYQMEKDSTAVNAHDKLKEALKKANNALYEFYVTEACEWTYDVNKAEEYADRRTSDFSALLLSLEPSLNTDK